LKSKHFNIFLKERFRIKDIYIFHKKIAPEKLERFALMKGEILPVCYKN